MEGKTLVDHCLEESVLETMVSILCWDLIECRRIRSGFNVGSEIVHTEVQA